MAAPSQVEGPWLGPAAQVHTQTEGGEDGLSVQRTPETTGSHWQRQRDCLLLLWA